MSVEELNILMPTLFLSGELTDIGWSNINTNDKQVLIGKAEDYISSSVLFDKGATETDGFEEAKNKAECCIIFDLLKIGMNSRADEIRAGLKSYSGPNVSETYADISDLGKLERVSDKYKKYLWKYTYRGV